MPKAHHNAPASTQQTYRTHETPPHSLQVTQRYECALDIRQQESGPGEGWLMLSALGCRRFTSLSDYADPPARDILGTLVLGR